MTGSQRLAEAEKRISAIETQAAKRDGQLTDALGRIEKMEARVPATGKELENEIGDMRAQLTDALARLEKLQQLVPVPG